MSRSKDFCGCNFDKGVPKLPPKRRQQTSSARNFFTCQWLSNPKSGHIIFLVSCYICVYVGFVNGRSIRSFIISYPVGNAPLLGNKASLTSFYSVNYKQEEVDCVFICRLVLWRAWKTVSNNKIIQIRAIKLYSLNTRTYLLLLQETPAA